MTYRAYAGIGSRDTPEPILAWMRKLGGYLHNQGWTLRSGGAGGADLAFEHGVNNELFRENFDNPQMGTDRHDRAKEIYLPWSGFLGSKSRLEPDNYPFTEEEINVAAHFHPAWHNCSPAAKKLHTRNVRQMVGCEQLLGEQIPSKFVVCWTKGGELVGGTAQALRIAEYLQIKVFNLGRAKDEADLMQILRELDDFQKANQ